MELAFLFLFFALLCASLYRYIHAVIGAPYIEETGAAALDSPDMILSFVGAYFVQQYNAQQASILRRFRSKYLDQDGGINDLGRQFLRDFAGDRIDDIASEIELLNTLDYACAALSKDVLNPYKLAFICATCSLFWFSLICLIPVLIWASLSPLAIVGAVLFFPPTVFSFWGWIK